MNAHKTILVVDDHEDDLVLLQQLLESHSYDVLLANNGEVAQKILLTHWVDCVISDVLMPIMDGLQLCRLIKANATLTHVVVILYTSMYSSDDDIKFAETVGADDYIIKPIEPKHLFHVLEQLIGSGASPSAQSQWQPSACFIDEKEQYTRQYNTQLVERLEDKVNKLNEEVEKRKNIEKSQSEILNSMMSAVITIDAQGIVLSFNRAAESLFGYPADEVIGENVKILMDDLVARQHDVYIDKYKKTGVGNIIDRDDGREVFGRRRNQKLFPMRLLVSELPRDVDGNQRFIGSCQDLTSLNAQDETFRRSQKMEALGKLTGGIAHDYNNMLGVVTGFAELLERELTDQPKLERYVQQIMHAGKRGITLTKKLLAFTRKKNSEAEVVNINVLLKSEQHMLRKILTAKIELKLNLAKGLWPTFIDEGDLEDAIINLSINAMHAMTGSGILIFQTNNAKLNASDARQLNLSAGEYVVLSIKDSGCGMSDEVKHQIFDPFYSTKGEKGTGLGLSQVHSFVSRSGGIIEVYSEEGHGTLFSIYFPRSQKLISQSMTKNNIDARYLRGSETILIVDDEPALVELAQCVLEGQGYHVITANSGQLALSILRKEFIDLVISDVIMPDMDGYQLISDIKLNHPAIKTQLVSGYSDSQYHSLTEDDPVIEGTLYKPYESCALLTRVRRLLDEV